VRLSLVSILHRRRTVITASQADSNAPMVEVQAAAVKEEPPAQSLQHACAVVRRAGRPEDVASQAPRATSSAAD